MTLNTVAIDRLDLGYLGLDRSLTYYVAGPMSNIKQFNFPMFELAAKHLRSEGYTVISPHEQDTPEVQQAAWASPDGKLDAAGKVGGLTWGQILAKDVELVADKIGGIIFLPDWYASRGARLEAFVGLLTGKHFGKYYQDGYYSAVNDLIYPEIKVTSVSANYVRLHLKDYMP